MSDKTEKKAGALHSELRIELHTQYAINTWSGRPASDGKPSLIGMPLFFRLISRINRDSLADNPWADAAWSKWSHCWKRPVSSSRNG